MIELPPAPTGVDKKTWEKRQAWLLLEVRMPRAEVAKVTSLRFMNLISWLIPLGHTWRFILDNKEELLDPKFKRKEGQA